MSCYSKVRFRFRLWDQVWRSDLTRWYGFESGAGVCAVCSGPPARPFWLSPVSPSPPPNTSCCALHVPAARRSHCGSPCPSAAPSPLVSGWSPRQPPCLPPAGRSGWPSRCGRSWAGESGPQWRCRHPPSRSPLAGTWPGTGHSGRRGVCRRTGRRQRRRSQNPGRMEPAHWPLEGRKWDG